MNETQTPNGESTHEKVKEQVKHKAAFSFEGVQNWAWGASLIFLGILFLLDNFGIVPVRTYNWWAVFILAPGLSLIARSFRSYQKNGEFTRFGKRGGLFGFILVVVAASFLFNFNTDFLLPILFIVLGAYLLLARRF